MRSHRAPGSEGPKVGGGAVQAAAVPGKRTLTESLDAAASAGSGQPLPGALQAKFGRTLGADLSGVRVHTGEASASAAEAIQARAYTTGQDIHFGAGHYDPSSSAGEHLLAHEVVHTVQQGGSAAGPSSAAQAKLEIGEAGGAAEREADTLAAVAVEGSGTATVTEQPPAGGHVVQREPKDAGADATVAAGDPVAKPAGDPAGGAGAGAAATPVVRAGIDLTKIGQDQGIRVAVAYYSSPTDIAANTSNYQAHKLKDVLSWGNVKPAGDHPNLKKVVDEVAAGTSDPEANTTPADAALIASAVAGNNAEFGYRAGIHAKQRNAIGGTAGALVVGAPMMFDESAGKPIEAIKAVSSAIGSLATGAAAPGSSGAPAPAATAAAANVAEVAFFTHGVEKNIGLGKDGWMGGGAVASALGDYATASVQVLVYGCSAAGGKDSFAETLATALAKAGHNARVFGHTTSGHATVNANGREFTATPNGNGGATVTSASDHEMVFTIDFTQSEMAPVAADLAIDLTKGSWYDGWYSNQYVVYDLITRVSKTWLAGGLSKFTAKGGFAGANDDGTASSQEAAYTLGVSRDPTVAALRTAWQAYRASAAGQADLRKNLPANQIAK